MILQSYEKSRAKQKKHVCFFFRDEESGLCSLGLSKNFAVTRFPCAVFTYFLLKNSGGLQNSLYICSGFVNHYAYEYPSNAKGDSRLFQDAARPEGMALWLLCPRGRDTKKRRGHSFRSRQDWQTVYLVHSWRHANGPARTAESQSRFGGRRVSSAIRRRKCQPR